MASPGALGVIRVFIFSPRKTATTSLKIALFFFLCSAIAAHEIDNDHEDEHCIFGASVNLTNATPNATGFFATSGYVFPPEATRFEDGVRYGCICDVIQCLHICPLVETEENATTYDGYVNFSAMPHVYTTDLTIDDDVEAQSPTQRFHTLVQDPCPEKYSFDLEPMHRKKDAFYLMRNGSLFMPLMDDPTMQLVEPDEYCLQLLDDGSGYVPRICSSEDYDDESYDDLLAVKYIGALVALPFLLATVIVYSVIPKFKSIHGITLRCYLCSLIVTFVALAVQNIPERADSFNTLCLCLGFITYFAFFASFLWLNVMCFDTWWRFGNPNFFGTRSMHEDLKKIIAYSVYAWGLPAVLTAICIIIEFAPGTEDSAFYPGFRMNMCWFYTMQVEALYFYGPAGVTIASNICFFISISVRLLLHKKDTQRHLNNEDSGRHNDNKQWLRLHVKLFIVMGVTWSTEIISWLWRGPKYVWYFTDTINALQGILIFVIFVCKRDIWRSLKNRFYKSESRVPDCELTDRTRDS